MDQIIDEVKQESAGAAAGELPPGIPAQAPTESPAESSGSTKYALTDIVLDGVDSFRPGFLAQLLMPYVDDKAAPRHWWWHTPTDDGTITGVVERVRGLQMHLMQLDAFTKADVTLDSPDEKRPGDVSAKLDLKEKSRKFLKTSTEVGNNEGSFTIQGRLRNVFGGAEVLEGEMAFGTKTHESYTVRLESPVQCNPYLKAAGTVFATEKTLSPYAQSHESNRGVQGHLRYIHPSGTHDLSYDAVLRYPTQMTPLAPLSLRRDASVSVKSALNYAFTRDTRDNPILPQEGSYFKMSYEFAGLLGDAHHIKSELDSSRSFMLAPSILLTLSARAGAMHGLFGHRTLFPDRFQLGGPLSVRLLRYNSMGPRDAADSLGGNFYYASGLSLWTHVPWREQWPLKIHAFANAGALARTPSALRPSVTCGLGLAYLHPSVRVEANFGVPLVLSRGDAPCTFQLGLGMNFL